MATPQHLYGTPRPHTASETAVTLKDAQQMLTDYVAVAAKLAKIKDDAKVASEPLNKELEALENALKHWAVNNKLAFGGKKMLKLEGGEFGHKLGTKKLSFPLDFDAERYLKVVKQVLPTAIVETADAKSVINAWDLVPNVGNKLSKLGIKVTQDDNFTISLSK